MQKLNFTLTAHTHPITPRLDLTPMLGRYSSPAERQAVFNNWRIKIHGLVDRPLEVSIEQLMQLPKREIPILLVCAGNRRKEQNMVGGSMAPGGRRWCA